MCTLEELFYEMYFEMLTLRKKWRDLMFESYVSDGKLRLQDVLPGSWACYLLVIAEVTLHYSETIVVARFLGNLSIIRRGKLYIYGIKWRKEDLLYADSQSRKLHQFYFNVVTLTTGNICY